MARPFQVQAAIQALHCAAPTYGVTDWASIVRFRDRLMAVMPTTVVALNRAVALSETRGVAESLDLLDELADELEGSYPLHAARGALLDRLGRPTDAATAYARAGVPATTETARRFLRGRATPLA
jgi:RNA polymerase sigma-70 factor (ECF subfamily)